MACTSETRMDGTEAPFEHEARPSWSVQHTKSCPAHTVTGSSESVTVKEVPSTTSKHSIPEDVTRALAAHTLLSIA
jgi:hypothetical protein